MMGVVIDYPSVRSSIDRSNLKHCTFIPTTVRTMQIQKGVQPSQIWTSRRRAPSTYEQIIFNEEPLHCRGRTVTIQKYIIKRVTTKTSMKKSKRSIIESRSELLVYGDTWRRWQWLLTRQGSKNPRPWGYLFSQEPHALPIDLSRPFHEPRYATSSRDVSYAVDTLGELS